MQEAVSAGVGLLSLEIGAVVELVPSEDAFAFRALHGLPDVRVNDSPRPDWDRSRAMPCSAAGRRS